MKSKIKALVLLTFLFAALPSLPAAPAIAGSIEFVNQDIHEVLYAVSLYADMSIIADDTVSGNMTFRFAGNDFSRAFDSFLLQNRLFVDREDDVWTVSRVQINTRDTMGGRQYSIDALDVIPARLLEKIATACELPVSWQILPSGMVSVHTGFLPPNEALEAVVRQFPGCVVREDAGLYIVETAKPRDFSSIAVNQGQIDITISVDDNNKQIVSVDIRKARFFDVADKLFTAASREYCFTVETDSIIPRTIFSNKSFDEAVELLCSQAGMEGIIEDGLYRFVPARDKRNLMANAGKAWVQYSLKFISTADFFPVLTGRFGNLDTVPLTGGYDFLCLVGAQQQEEIAAFIADNDRSPFSRLVTLRYLTSDSFVKHLPPGIGSNLIVQSGNGNSFYYIGSEESYNRLLAVLPEIDKPVRQIRYDVLIVQFQETKNSSWKAGITVGNVAFGDRNSAAVQLGSVLNLNFNVVTAFGLTFASSLQSAISENKASVFADTTLHGVSGEKISFSNTNTYRYRDNNVDPETGKPIYSGITREIAAGLTLEITGSVSGDGMITSKVTAAVSRRGADVSSSTGNPPPTSEKTITTEVRSHSGEPVVLSGLVQNDDAIISERVPFLSKIPLIGKLFSAKTTTKEHSEMIIYLLPNAENDFSPDAPLFETDGERSFRIFQTIVKSEEL